MNTLRVEHDPKAQGGAVARITLCRPDVRNAFNDELANELRQAFTNLPTSTRVIVLTGEGAAFCAGADLAWMKRSAAYSREDNVREARAMAELFALVDGTPQAVIARVNGPAMGGGLGLLACCDMAVSVDSARFGFTETRLGLVPAVISPYVLRKTGVAAMRRYFLTGELFDAATAQAMGLLHVVVPADGLDAAVAGLVESVLACGPAAVAAAKKLIANVAGRPPTEVLQSTAEVIAGLRASAEGQEGLGAFLQKRKPAWNV